jgi:hypothetical protein
VVDLKGQLTIQYLASFIFFLGLVIYIYFSYSSNLPAYVEEVRKEDVRSKAFQLSEILLNDPGDPANWGPGINPNRIGLSDENSNKTNLISKSKVDELESLCSNFEVVQQKLALNRSFSIYIFNVSQSTGNRNLIADCIPPNFLKTSINATIKRITALNNTGKLELAELIVQM